MGSRFNSVARFNFVDLDTFHGNTQLSTYTIRTQRVMVARKQ